MASVNFEKLKGSSTSAILRHCDKEKRKELNHSNKEINLDETHRNWTLYDLDYESTLKKFKDRLAYLDTVEGQNKRKDRVEAFSLCVPMPLEIEDLYQGKEETWFKKVVDVIGKQYGHENIVNAYVHFDEKHRYLDATTKEMRESLYHMHVIVMPVDENEKLNGKKFSSKENMIKLNNSIDEMCKGNFLQRSFRKARKKDDVLFQTGDKDKSRGRVEDLKLCSRKLEAELVAAMELTKDREKEAIEAKKTAEEEKEKHREAQERYEKKERDLETRERDVGMAEGNMRRRETRNKEKEEDLKFREGVLFSLNDTSPARVASSVLGHIDFLQGTRTLDQIRGYIRNNESRIDKTFAYADVRGHRLPIVQERQKTKGKDLEL